MKSAKPLNKKHQLIVFILIGITLLSTIVMLVTDSGDTMDESDPLLWVLLAFMVLPVIATFILMPIFFKQQRKLEKKIFEKLDSPEAFDEAFTIYGQCLVVNNGTITSIFPKSIVSKDGIRFEKKKEKLFFSWNDFQYCALSFLMTEEFLLSEEEIDLKNLDHFSGIMMTKNIEIEKCIKLFSGLTIDEEQYNLAKAEQEQETAQDEASKFTYKLNRTKMLLQILIVSGILVGAIGLGLLAILVLEFSESIVSPIVIGIAVVTTLGFFNKNNQSRPRDKYTVTKNYVSYNNGLKYFVMPWAFVKKITVTKKKISLYCEANNYGNLMRANLHMKYEPVVWARIMLMKVEHNLAFEVEEQDIIDSIL